MRCERCKFENIPGQKTCIKCGSTLEITHTQINVHPPRMSKWKKPFRNSLRLMRKSKAIPQEKIKIKFPRWFSNSFNDSFLGLCLSIIPGLAHLIQRRFREIRWYFLAWVVLLTSGLFLYGSTAGYLCIGLAVGMHAGIALQYGILKELVNFTEKIITAVIVLIAFTVIYRYAPRIIAPNLTSGYSSLTIPFHNVEAEDFLLAWRDMGQKSPIDRGSLVLIHPVNLRTYGVGRNTVTVREDVIIGQVVAIPGEKLEIQHGVFIANGLKLDLDKYPVPQWLQKVKFSAIIPANSYFVSVEYNLRAHGIAFNTSYVDEICIVKAENIEAKAFMRWWPLAKRGFIR